jgi:hypothetical protein
MGCNVVQKDLKLAVVRLMASNGLVTDVTL